MPLNIQAESLDTDRIVAVVNDDIIVLSELNEALLPYEKKIRSYGYSSDEEKKALYQVREELLNQLIDNKLKDQEIVRKEITIEDKEINNTIERIKQENYFTDEEFREILAREGMTIEDYFQQTKEEILRAKLLNLEIRSKIIITQEDVKTYYESHPEKYGSKIQYHLKHIIMKVPTFADINGKKEIKDKMEIIRQRLKKGESFEALAMRYSESPLAEEGGDLGMFEPETLSAQIRTAIKDLKPGEFTDVLDTEQGFQIFMLQDIVEIPGPPLETVSDDIQRILYNESSNQKYTAWIEGLRSQAHIKIIR